MGVAALGPPVLAVLLFEILLNGTAMFNHGNINLPRQIDRYLRLLVVTPDMHRVHHAVKESVPGIKRNKHQISWDRFAAGL